MIEINSVIQWYFQIQLTDRACDRLSLLVRVSDDLRITLVSRQSGISDESDLDLLEGDIVRNIQVNIRMYDGWDE